MLEGLDKFDSVVESWFDAVEVAAQQSAAGLGQVALTRILEESPQYTGDFVGGWEVSFNTPAYIWRPPRFIKRSVIEAGESEPFQKGDEPAIEYALAKGEPRLTAAAAQPLGTSIYLSNSAVHDESYAWKIELGQIDFRPVNPNADRVVERGVLFAERRFKHIGRSEFTLLRSLGV